MILKQSFLEIPDNIYEDILEFVYLRFINILEANFIKQEPNVNKKIIEHVFLFKIQNEIPNIRIKDKSKIFKYTRNDLLSYKYFELIKLDQFEIDVQIDLSNEDLAARTTLGKDKFVINIEIPKKYIKKIVFNADKEAFNDAISKLKQFVSHELIHVIQKITDTANIDKKEIHVFMPHEFYPRLKESIIRFYKQVSEIDEEDILEFIKHFVGYYGITKLTDGNFKMAIQNIKTDKHQQIYKNMVNKFVKAVSKDQDFNLLN